MKLKIRFVFDRKGCEVDGTEALFEDVRQTFNRRLAAALELADQPPAPSRWHNALTTLGEFLLILGGLAATGLLLALLAFVVHTGWEMAG